ncbi:MAG: ribbon-helix-helix domain-containing protein [Thermoplasmata archaeon]|nr:ribbon-helix-helix domain-containing protein [Thermoplasmata archaeon]
MQEQVDERISARFEKAMMDEIDVLVQQEGYTNRSEFLRTAARTLLEAQQRRNSIQVEVSPLLMEFIQTMVDRGFYRSREHAIQAAIDSFFTEERVKEAFTAMKRMEIAAGKKADIDVEAGTSRQIVKQ